MSCKFSRIIIVLFVSLTLLQGGHAESSGANIKFGGVWLKGKDSEASSRFPVGHQFIKQGASFSGTQSASKELLQIIRKNQKSGAPRLIDRVAPDDFVPLASSGNALLLALAVNYEHCESQVIGGVQKLFAEIGFDIVLCNMSDRSIVFTLPGRLQHIDSGSDSKSLNMLKFLYSEKLFSHFIDLAGYAWSGDLAFCSLGMTKMTVFDDAKERFPKWMKEAPEPYYSQVISCNLYQALGMPVVPYSNGEEVMYARLREEVSDSSALKAQKINELAQDGEGFILRKPDYQIELVIPGFHEAIAQRTDTGNVAQHCAYARVIIKSKHGEAIYNNKHDANVTSILPSGQKLKPLWLASDDATDKMFRIVAKKIKDDDSSAIKRMIRETTP